MFFTLILRWRSWSMTHQKILDAILICLTLGALLEVVLILLSLP